MLQTSAPSIVHVDEFHEELSMAERKKREAERLRLNANAPNKQRFFMELNKKVIWQQAISKVCTSWCKTKPYYQVSANNSSNDNFLKKKFFSSYFSQVLKENTKSKFMSLSFVFAGSTTKTQTYTYTTKSLF